YSAPRAEAEAKGYAEADPSADVDGWDPAYKLSILVSLLEGRWFPPDGVRRSSLRSLTLGQGADAARPRAGVALASATAGTTTALLQAADAAAAGDGDRAQRVIDELAAAHDGLLRSVAPVAADTTPPDLAAPAARTGA